MIDTIVILDYSVYERQKIKQSLDNIGSFNVIEVSSSLQFKLLSLNLQNLRLIIMDIAFPSESEGFEILKSIRSNKYTANVPVIIVSRSDELIHKTAALHFEVYDYIFKPFQVISLENAIRSILMYHEDFHFDTVE